MLNAGIHQLLLLNPVQVAEGLSDYIDFLATTLTGYIQLFECNLIRDALPYLLNHRLSPHYFSTLPLSRSGHNSFCLLIAFKDHPARTSNSDRDS